MRAETHGKPLREGKLKKSGIGKEKGKKGPGKE